MTHRSRTAMLFGASVVALVLAACGVSSENAPRPITDTISPDTGPTPSVDSSPDTATPATPTTIGPITSTVTGSSSPDPSQNPTRPRRVSPPHSTGPSPSER